MTTRPDHLTEGDLKDLESHLAALVSEIRERRAADHRAPGVLPTICGKRYLSGRSQTTCTLDPDHDGDHEHHRAGFTVGMLSAVDALIAAADAADQDAVVTVQMTGRNGYAYSVSWPSKAAERRLK